MSVSYRRIGMDAGEPDRLLDLFKAVYGGSRSLQNRWGWQYRGHPRRADIKIYVAEDGDTLAGATSFLPMELLAGGERLACHHASDSMVHPSFRRRGIMSELYRAAIDDIGIHCAKGVNPGMDKLFEKMGYVYVTPDTHLVAFLSPWKLFLEKATLSRPEGSLPAHDAVVSEGFEPVTRFGAEFDAFAAAAQPQYPVVASRDASYMNWRYLDIPHQSYRAYYGRRGSEIVSALVVTGWAGTGSIVDLVWDARDTAEPARTIDFAKRLMKKAGFVRLKCWATLASLRATLERAGFVDRGERPRVFAYGRGASHEPFGDGGRIHLVDGDCDSEYV